MRLIEPVTRRHIQNLVASAALITLAFVIPAPRAGAQTNAASSQPGEARPALPPPGTIQTIFLKNITQQSDLNDIATDLRNALPKAKIFFDQSQSAITVCATDEDLAAAEKMIAELDLPRKVYRLTYTFTDVEDGKRTGSQHFAFLAVAGDPTIFKQGSRVPIVIGTLQKESTAQSSEIQYLDVGFNINVTVTGSPEHVMLRSKIEQSSVGGDKSAVVAPDPVVRQTVLQGSTELTEKEPLILGSLDIPGTTRHQEIEVVAELIH
jgi:type II secretory pathway component GspD/PulD (secretin)